MSSSRSNRIFSNYVLVVVSISSVLFFLSSFTFFVLNSNKIIDDFKEKIPVVVFLEDGASDIEVSQFEKKLSIDPNIKNDKEDKDRLTDVNTKKIKGKKLIDKENNITYIVDNNNIVYDFITKEKIGNYVNNKIEFLI